MYILIIDSRESRERRKRRRAGTARGRENKEGEEEGKERHFENLLKQKISAAATVIVIRKVIGLSTESK